MADQKKIPARVAALAAQVGDTPLDWKEREDGSIVIVFNSKGKQTFEPTRASAEEPAPEAQVVKSQKKKEK